MKKMILAALVLSSVSALAATSDILYLKGVVAQKLSIDVTANSSAESLDLLTNSSGALVATVEEISNNRLGYDITMYSTNAGSLVHQQDATQKLAYKVSYDGGSLITPPAMGSPVTVKSVSSLTGLTTDVSNVNITYTGNPDLVAGTYDDTITFSIAAK